MRIGFKYGHGHKPSGSCRKIRKCYCYGRIEPMFQKRKRGTNRLRNVRQI